MVGIVLLAIVFGGWLSMNNIPQIARESKRYSAVESAAGMLEALSAIPDGDNAPGVYEMVRGGVPDRIGEKRLGGIKHVFPIAESQDPIGYWLEIEDARSPDGSLKGRWARVRLFDNAEMDIVNDEPFTEFRVLVGKGLCGQ